MNRYAVIGERVAVESVLEESYDAALLDMLSEVRCVWDFEAKFSGGWSPGTYWQPPEGPELEIRRDDFVVEAPKVLRRNDVDRTAAEYAAKKGVVLADVSERERDEALRKVLDDMTMLEDVPVEGDELPGRHWTVVLDLKMSLTGSGGDVRLEAEPDAKSMTKLREDVEERLYEDYESEYRYRRRGDY